MGINVIIQARVGSERLPGKVLMRLGEHSVLEYVVARCKQIEGIQNIIVATSNTEKDNEIEKWCLKNQTLCFRGSENDVLSRFIDCIKKYPAEYIIRVTADCPFVDYETASRIVKLVQSSKCDIVNIVGKVPRGLNIELISSKALQNIYDIGKENRHREHVTLYAYEFTNKFNWKNYVIDENLQYPELRITLDTQEDYQLCERIAQKFQNPLVSSYEVVRFLIQNPDIASINKHIKQKPVNKM